MSVLKYASAKKIGSGYFARALKRIEASPLVTPEEKKEPVRSTQLRAYAFGNSRVYVNEKEVTTTDWDSASAKEMLFLLLAHPQGLRKEEILEKLWPEIPPAKASGVFHSTTHRARRALCAECIVRENGTYRLSRELGIWSDVQQFEELLASARRAASDEERAKQYGKAVTLYQGDYFTDSYNDWCSPIRSELQSKYLDALAALSDYHASRNQNTEALAFMRQIIRKDPLREEIYQAMMRIHAKAGDRSSALKVYEECQRVLREELNLQPSQETRTLYQKIQEGRLN